MIKISEIFHSIQGEGLYQGMPSYFIRLATCNLHCKWCDTPYASWNPEFVKMSIPKILEELNSNPFTHHVVVTGGEPFLQAELVDLVKALKERKFVITIETAGTIYFETEADLISISPKFSSSDPINEKESILKRHKRNRNSISEIRKFFRKKKCQLKFVVESEADISEIEEFLNSFRKNSVSPEQIFLMPCSQTKIEHDFLLPKVANLCQETGFRLANRLHLQIWDNSRGR